MNDDKETNPRAPQEPRSDDTVTVFCFSREPELLEAFSVTARSTYWAEKRKALDGVMYPYWLVCRADRRDKIEEMLKKSGVQWEDVESHFYSAVKDQSPTGVSMGNLKNPTKKPAQPHRTNSREKKWWRFWK